MFTATIFAKPGELMQGEFTSGKRFLVSNKSSLLYKSSTSVHPVSTFCQLNYKSQQAFNLFKNNIHQRTTSTKIHTLKQQGNIPVGKGLSSSSADVLGILCCLNNCYETNYSISSIYKLAAQIEPTDPCLHSGNILFYQHEGNVVEELPNLPYSLIYFDTEQEKQIDTIDFSKKVNYTNEQQLQYENLYALLKFAMQKKDYAIFFNCITQSAILNQYLLPKKNFNLLLDFAKSNNLGVFVAHSGTVMGLVITPQQLNMIIDKALIFIKKNWCTHIIIE